MHTNRAKGDDEQQEKHVFKTNLNVYVVRALRWSIRSTAVRVIATETVHGRAV